jgi:minor histocompatibility antigen H13
MISVATGLDVPIKLTITTGAKMKNILGLGDIVVPGMMVGLALRFDLWKYYHDRSQTVKLPLSKDIKDDKTGEITTVVDWQDSVKKPEYKIATGSWGDWFWASNWSEILTCRLPAVSQLPDRVLGGDFPKPYFHASIAGYAFGMLATLAVLVWFRHGQPALLYLVPTVVGSIFATAWARGEMKELLMYTEDGSLDKEDVVVDVVKDGRVEKPEEAHPSQERNGEVDAAGKVISLGESTSTTKAHEHGLRFRVSLGAKT